MCEKSTNVREGSCIVVIMVAKGGEGGVTDAPLKKHESNNTSIKGEQSNLHRAKTNATRQNSSD